MSFWLLCEQCGWRAKIAWRDEVNSSGKIYAWPKNSQIKGKLWTHQTLWASGFIFKIGKGYVLMCRVWGEKKENSVLVIEWDRPSQAAALCSFSSWLEIGLAMLPKLGMNSQVPFLRSLDGRITHVSPALRPAAVISSAQRSTQNRYNCWPGSVTSNCTHWASEAQSASTPLSVTDHGHSSLWNVIAFIMELDIWNGFIIFNVFLVYGVFSYMNKKTSLSLCLILFGRKSHWIFHYLQKLIYMNSHKILLHSRSFMVVLTVVQGELTRDNDANKECQRSLQSACNVKILCVCL